MSLRPYVVSFLQSRLAYTINNGELFQCRSFSSLFWRRAFRKRDRMNVHVEYVLKYGHFAYFVHLTTSDGNPEWLRHGIKINTVLPRNSESWENAICLRDLFFAFRRRKVRKTAKRRREEYC
jgi:hypothetical protein